jgi:hypothetical protein
MKPDLLSLLGPSVRRWRIGEEYGEVFAPDVDFEGLTLTLELLDVDEAKAMVDFLVARRPHWLGANDT